ncbi:MAG: hypothetical protein LBK76_07415 [Verrucomicrobiales bacterium]|nr:hypothetical protein [Verrucomicrobiales bacterium]
MPQDERVTVSGLTERDFPLRNEPWQSVPPHFPWPHFNGWWGGPLLRQGYVGDEER